MLFCIPVLFVLTTGYITVSETATSNVNRLRIEDSHHNFDELNRQRYPIYDEVIDMPCDRRAQSDPLVHQTSPNRLAPGTGNQHKPVLSRRNQEEVLPYVPTESLAPPMQSKPVIAKPNPKIPVKQNTQQDDRQEIATQPGVLPKIKQQEPQNYYTENKGHPQFKSEEVYMRRHNNEAPSHKKQHDTIPYVPVQDRITEPNESNNYHDFTSPNLNRDAVPSEDNHNFINTLKPEPNHNSADDSSESCNITPEDFAKEGRRSMSKENTNGTNRLSELQSPSTKIERSGQASARATVKHPKILILTKPTYELSDPTRGAGISPLSEVRGLMMKSNRVCFACSTLNDASCLIPDRTTTIKYCRQGQDVCVTKSYRKNAGASLVVIRDCDTSCDAETPGLNTRYESCAVCKEDLCNSLNINSAFSISPINSIFILLCTAFVKYVL